MDRKLPYYHLEKYTDNLRSKGRYTFTLDELRNSVDVNYSALKKTLNRLSGKGKIISIRKGFYLIIPPEYSAMQILPPILFVDDLMKYQGRSYYVGLISAAVFHGAGHQQPQEFFVITEKPVLRNISCKGIRINYVIKSVIPDADIEEKKTDAGYVRVSNPWLTALDLIRYESKIGGLSRVVTVLDELSEELNPKDGFDNLINNTPVAYWQRLGYLFDKVLGQKALAESVFDIIRSRKLNRVPLKPGGIRHGVPVDKQWKILINAKPESDL